MKVKFLSLFLFLSCTISAQLIISPAVQFSIRGNMLLTLHNSDLVNNGTLETGSSRISFTGNGISFIGGSQPIQFSEIEINKASNSLVRLENTIGVANRLLFTSGFLNLNGFNADLGTTGHLDGEQENSRVTGANGGEVLFNTNLNFPTGSNPGNLGVFITSNANLGNVTIRRGHRSQATIPGSGSSLLRYYDILAANNTNLNATIRMRYFDGELNGLNENTLTFFRSQDNVNWSNLGLNTGDVTADIAEINGVGSFARFTLSNVVGALPVHFTQFNARCEEHRVSITWKTSQEGNSDRFDIERLTAASQWTVIGSLAAAGNSNSERTYSFNDEHPQQSNYYRIAEYDRDGRVQYTGIFGSSCDEANFFSLWPNPFHDNITINIATANPSQAVIKLFDSKGALVKRDKAMLLQGSNQVVLNIGSLANGVYTLDVSWNNGQMKRSVQLIKQ